MFRIKMICHDYRIDVEPYEDEPAIDVNSFLTRQECLSKIYELADAEAEYLNDGCDENVSFNAVETDTGMVVNYYYLEGEEDTTGNTEIVTEYIVEQYMPNDCAEFVVRISQGDVFIDGKFVRQLCWDNDAIGYAVTAWLNGNTDDETQYDGLPSASMSEWSKYICYLSGWAAEHIGDEYFGMSPACFDEWRENEDNE